MIKNSDNLKVTVLVGDIYTYDSYQYFNIVLLDSMFYFEKHDKQRETGLIDKIAKLIKNNSVICICIQDTDPKVKTLKDTIKNTNLEFFILNDSSLTHIAACGL